jgi:hypothetical protein
LRDRGISDVAIIVWRRRRTLSDRDVSNVAIIVGRRRRALRDRDVSTIVIRSMMSHDAHDERQNKHH